MSTDLSPALNTLSLAESASSSVLSLASAGEEFESASEGILKSGNGSPSDKAPMTAGQLQSRIKACLGDINSLNDKIYEIEELRHSTSSAPARLDALLSSLDASIATLQYKIEAVQTDSKNLDKADTKSRDVLESAEDLQEEWKKALDQVRVVKEEMREDGWLVRFRTTADQAEAMMDPLQKSLTTCQVQAAPQPIQYESDMEDELSISQLKTLAKSHEAMKGTYVPSIVKILRMMDRSINDRSTFNGEALRRFSEMSSRWTSLQRSLAHLDAKIRLLFEQYELSPAGEPIEVLVDALSPSDTLADSDYFGVPKQAPGSHRNSVSSRSSSNPRRQSVSPAFVETATISSTLKKRPSVGSTRTAASDRPRWNGSTKPSTSESASTTPTARRVSSYGAYTSSGSPAPPVPPLPDFARAFPNSRIPVRSPPRSVASATFSPPRQLPGLAVSTSASSILLSPPTSVRTLRSPEPGRPSMRTPRKSTGIGLGITGAGPSTPNMAQRAVSSSTTKSHRVSMGKPPPSSFRSMTPTPSRPQSRMSNASNYATGPMQPFVPSKYDLLDQEVQKILEHTKFDLMVSRLDASLQKTQRKGDNDEWKGEFIFGAGEKATPVKLLKLNTAIAGRKEMRYKVMGRAAGAWTELGVLLQKRMERSQGIFD